MRPEQFDILLCENLYGDIVRSLRGIDWRFGLVPGATSARKAQCSRPCTARRLTLLVKHRNRRRFAVSDSNAAHIDERAAADRIETPC